ncbi:MAG: dihydrofolate reductase family protein [Bacteroides sp.]|nr:dihydrofolate reductase family protein [Roseburia sp.]MCM1345670.1 dihydrofolate reductase family protein [Bacteroides sp.]MCM1419905.1 dihydrofolate reductase family protein [Bacteroides sp.]
MMPKVICHIMSSVDGRLLPRRWTAPFDGTNPSELFKEYAAIGQNLCTDAWMFGKATTKEVFPNLFKSKGEPTEETGKVHIGNRNSTRLFITIDPDADILFTSDTFRGDNILTILGANATTDYLAALEEKGISYIVMERVDNLKLAMELIAKHFGVKCISLQGGGIIDGAMLAQGLLSELSLVIYPGIDGLSTIPSIFEYIGQAEEKPAEGQALQLLSVEQKPLGIVWLHYKFHKNKRL